MWRWGGRGQKATCESGSKARMGIRSDRAWAGAHLCRLGCGRCGSGGQAPGRGAAGSGGSAAAPLHHRRRCSPPRGPRSPTAPALSRRAPPGTEGCPPRRCWGQEWAVRRQGPPARLAAQASLALLAHQLSHGPVTTSPGSRLSQELSPDPAERLWFSGIPEGTGGEAGASDGSANHQRCSGLYPAVSTHGDLGLGRRRTQKPQRVPALECGSCPCWPPWAKWQGPGGRALLCSGAGWGRHRPMAPGWYWQRHWVGGTQRPSWDSWPGGHPQLGCWQPVESGWHSTPGDRSSQERGQGCPQGRRSWPPVQSAAGGKQRGWVWGVHQDLGTFLCLPLSSQIWRWEASHIPVGSPNPLWTVPHEVLMVCLSITPGPPVIWWLVNKHLQSRYRPLLGAQSFFWKRQPVTGKNKVEVEVPINSSFLENSLK